MKEGFKFLGTLGAIVGVIFAVVGGSMAVMTIWMSAQAAGFVWCGIMFLILLVAPFWWIYDEQRFTKRQRVKRSLALTEWYSSRL